MNSACSICMETFSPRSDISTTPCGHVFHTNCIEKWLDGRNPGGTTRNHCSQCRKNCTKTEIIKLYPSGNASENNLVEELLEKIKKLEEEANTAQRQCLVLKQDKLNWQGEKLALQKALKQEKLNFRKEKLESKEGNLRFNSYFSQNKIR